MYRSFTFGSARTQYTLRGPIVTKLKPWLANPALACWSSYLEYKVEAYVTFGLTSDLI